MKERERERERERYVKKHDKKLVKALTWDIDICCNSSYTHTNTFFIFTFLVAKLLFKHAMFVRL